MRFKALLLGLVLLCSAARAAPAPLARDTVPNAPAEPPPPAIRSGQAPQQPGPRRTAEQLRSFLVDNGFNSILHGQPVPPGFVKLVPSAAWRRFPSAGNPVAVELSASYTPPWTAFFRNSLFGVLLPVQLNGAASGVGNVGFFWQQRWLLDLKHELSLASYIEFDFPTAHVASGLQVILDAIVVKVLGPGVVYINALGRSSIVGGASGWGGVAGYKWVLTPRFALSAAYVLVHPRHQERTQSILEYSTEFIASRVLSIGVGGLVGLSSHDFTASYGFGAIAFIVF